jgi:hypothetical protein
MLSIAATACGLFLALVRISDVAPNAPADGSEAADGIVAAQIQAPNRLAPQPNANGVDDGSAPLFVVHGDDLILKVHGGELVAACERHRHTLVSF